MALPQTTIGGLPAATSPALSDVTVWDNGTTTSKITGTQLQTLLGGGGGSQEVTGGADYALTTSYAAVQGPGAAPAQLTLRAGVYDLVAVVPITAGSTAGDEYDVELWDATNSALIVQGMPKNLASSYKDGVVLLKRFSCSGTTVVQVRAKNATGTRGTINAVVSFVGPLVAGYGASGVTVDASYTDSSYVAANAVDSDPITSRWTTFPPGNLPCWWRAQLASPATVTQYVLGGYSGDGASGYPTAWTFQGSNDGSTWTTLDTQSTTLSAGENTFNISNTTAYAYYRIDITAGTDNYAQLTDVKMYTSGTTAPILVLKATGANAVGGSYALPVLSSFTPTYGESVSVTLTGSGFTGATGVSFNGTAGTSVVVVSDTEITVTSPASFTNGPISVATPGGTAVSYANFTNTQSYPTSGLVAHWGFDDGSGSVAVDDSGNGHNLSLNGIYSWSTTDKKRGSGSWNPSNSGDTYGVAGGVSLGTNFTVAAWAKFTSYTGPYGSVIFAWHQSYGGFQLGALAGSGSPFGGFWYSPGGTSYGVTSTVNFDNSWHHHALTYDGSNVIYYIDGAVMNSISYSSGFGISDSNFLVGGAWDSGDRRSLNGFIDEGLLYSRALSAGEIASLAT